MNGKIITAQYAREKDVPYLGICLGMQVAVIEFARNVLGYSDAHSTEMTNITKHPVIDLMERGVVHHIEGSMNGPLGAYCSAGKMRGLGVLRSHGGRWQAIQNAHEGQVNPLLQS